MKRGSACYPKCQCVLTIAAGVCSGEEVNDQQATAVTTVQMDASNPKLLIQSTMSQQFPAEGAGRMDGQWKGSAMVLNDYMGLNLLGRGQTGSGRLSDSEAKL